MEEAEAIAFYAALDSDGFANYMLDEQVTANIEDKEYRIADFCAREALKGFWEGCMDIINEWAGDDFSETRKRSYAIWLAEGVVVGYIWGKVEK